MKSKILVLGLVCLLIIFLVYCKKGTHTTPERPKAVIRITVDRVPILMQWEWWTELWCMRPLVTVRETNGVGFNCEYARSEFIYKNQAGYEPQTVEGQRLNA